ncbi:MAG: Fe-S cluster assembly protein SufD [Hyphomicrobium sp.]
MSAVAEKDKAARPMTVQVIRTKAEQALSENFARAAGRLPGGGWAPAVRAAAIGAFAASGLPYRRIEEWKYTDLRTLLKEAYPPPAAAVPKLDDTVLAALLGPELSVLASIRVVFINGRLASIDPSLDGGPGAKAFFDSFGDSVGTAEFEWIKPHLEAGAAFGAIPALNAAFASDGALLRITPGAHLDLPIHLVFAADTNEPSAITTRNLIEVGRGARCVILESHVGSATAPRQANTATELRIQAEAHVDHVKVVAEGEHSTHLGHADVHIGRNATYRSFQCTSGTALVRNQAAITFTGEGACLDFSGAFLGRKSQHIDTTLVVDHAVPRCQSRELFKGVLDGQARGIFQGKVIVRPDAQKTDGKQMAQALMLSPDAEFDSKPELEIYADDVVCGHGSTTAELDADLMFYCRSRGIPEAEARALLIESFIGEAFDRISHEGIRASLLAMASDWLGAARS